MYLSRLDLHGFKSFAQKTTVTFAPGVTAIVGPNGCGKSNIIDAMRWVLGEQRARVLRSDAMAGVLFNGAAGRKPLGMAEVSMTVENTRGVLPTEYAEVTVTRRLYRNGDSEYRLNGTPCRLRDVLDLFTDTGLGAGAYSVIELSMVEDILSDNAADRRRLFEEAAGVVAYKRRRDAALKRLAATEADRTRLDDLVDEVERQARRLERQAQTAQRAERLAARLRALDLGLAAHDARALDAEGAAREASARGHRDTSERLAAALALGEAGLESDRTALLHAETALGEAARALAAHTDAVAALDAERRVADERAAADRRALERLAQDAAADAAREDSLRAQATDARTRADALRADTAQAETALADAEAARTQATAAHARARATLDAARRAAADAARAHADARARADRARDRAEALRAESARLADARAALERGPADPTDDPAGPRAALDHAEASLARAAHTADARAADARTARDAHEAARDAVRGARAAAEAARAELSLLDRLRRAGAGSGDARATLRARFGDALAPLAEALDADHRAALDAALGPWADALVAATDADADAALAFLREGTAGRATVLVPGPDLPPAPPLPAGLAPLAVRAARPDAAALVAHLLGRVALADSLADARRIARAHPGVRAVTAAGEWAEGAAVGGGASSAASARFGWTERADSAREALGTAEASAMEAEAGLEAARAALAESDAAAAEAARLRDAARQARDAARSAADRAEAREAARADERARLDARAAEIDRARADLPDADALDADAATRAADEQAAARARADADAAERAADAARHAADAAWADARLALARARTLADAAHADAARLDAEADALRDRAAIRADESARLRAGLDAAAGASATRAERLDAARVTTDALLAASAEAETAVLERRAAVSDGEKTLRAGRAEREAAQQALAADERRLAEVAVRLDALAERVATEHAADLDAADDVLDGLLAAEGGFDPATARAEVPRLRDGLRQLGPVNAVALESYAAERERLAFLTAQRADVLAAEATLRETIREINETARARFAETFAQVRAAFQSLFADLFGGDAQADIELDGDDPLEAPVRISARPTGKRPVGLAQLSGGEKTLTATALLFAIYLVKPSPFCILDEVDAPLDDANVARFMRLIRSFADRTQFILVTHNKLTMEAADRMYGVTMPTPGVSRLVGVRLDAAEDVAPVES